MWVVKTLFFVCISCFILLSVFSLDDDCLIGFACVLLPVYLISTTVPCSLPVCLCNSCGGAFLCSVCLPPVFAQTVILDCGFVPCLLCLLALMINGFGILLTPGFKIKTPDHGKISCRFGKQRHFKFFWNNHNTLQPFNRTSCSTALERDSELS